MTRNHYAPTFKAQVVQELLQEEKTLTQVAAEHGVHPSQLITWRAPALEGLPSLFARFATMLPEMPIAPPDGSDPVLLKGACFEPINQQHLAAAAAEDPLRRIAE